MSILLSGHPVVRHVRSVCARFPMSDEGQDNIEYALLAALLAVAAIAFVILVGPYLQDLFQHIVDQLASLNPGSGGGVGNGQHPHPCPPRNPHC